jgi:Zn-finger nucleic acid-binding protein
MSSLTCPRCRIDLNRRTIAEPDYRLVIDTCPECGGIWFDRGLLERLEQLEHIVEPTFVEVREIPSPDAQMEILQCPSCKKEQIMRKEVHFRDSRVITDHCPGCGGVWLDGGELKAIQEENWLLTLGRILKFLSGTG